MASGDYALVHHLRKKLTQKEAQLPPSDKKTITPDYLLGHENHTDQNTYTPEDMKKEAFGPEAVKQI
jgi:hypothetical protein